MDYIYRKAKNEDIINIAKLVSKLLGTCNLQKGEDILQNNINEIKVNIDNYYVCEVNDAIIGACGISNIKRKDNYGLDLINIREILYLVVDNNFQKQGIGTKLLTLCCENISEAILYEAWGDNGEYVNSKFILQKIGFRFMKNLGNDYYKNHGYCSFCCNKYKQCNECLAEIWILN